MSDPPPGYKRCPDCAEDVRAEARRCRFCGYSFEPRGRMPSALEALFRRPAAATASAEQLLAAWGTELEPGEELESMIFCRLDEADGFLAVTGRRVLFHTARRPRCLLEAALDRVSGSARPGRFGRSRVELDVDGRRVVLSGFVSRAELAEAVRRLGVAPP